MKRLYEINIKDKMLGRRTMIPKCPDCKTNESVDYTGDDRLSESGELYDVKVYKCHKCGCEFDEEEV